MIVDRRRIDRLSLRVSRAADAPRAADTIREALRVATMPGDGHPGRLFIRRVDLGTIRLGDGPQPLARRVEAYLRRLRVEAVPIADPRSPHADVVIARDPIEPLVLALAHAAARRRLSAWYWPRVHEQLTPGRTPSEIAALVWSLLATRRDAVATVPAVVGAVLEREGAVEVLAAIDAIVGEQLARALEVEPMPAEAAAALTQTIVPPRWRPAVSEVITKWAGGRRAAWLVTAVVRAAYPRISAARLTGLVRGAIVTSAREQPTREQASGVDLPRGDRSAAQPSPELASAQPQPDAPRHDRAPAPEPGFASSSKDAPALGSATASSPVTTAASELARPVAPAEPTPGEPAQPESPLATSNHWALIERPQPTRYGGLYFLLRPLARLGLDVFVSQHPELEALDLGVRTIDRIASALGIAVDDPIRVALTLPPLPPVTSVPSPPPFAGLWTERVPAPVIAGLDPRHDLHDLIGAWHAAVSAWLDRHAELDLPTVVTRDAAVLCTRTHLDVIFDMEASDVRIRKAALDIDPGWVPWLGRVVQFHYVYGGLLDG